MDDDIMKEFTNLTPDEVAELIVETEKIIQAIKDGDIEGEYFEF